MNTIISYFNKICIICCVHTLILILNVWLKSVLHWLKSSIFFLGDCFLLVPPVYYIIFWGGVG